MCFSDIFSFSNALNLTDPQKNWINDLRNKQAKDAITNYLNSFSLIFSPTTPEYENAKSFAYQAIVALFTNSLMTINDIDFDDRIINKLTGKAKCVYNKLLSSGASNFHNMITDLFIEFGDNNIGGRDLTFKMSSSLPNNILARTNGNGFGNFTISINSNQMNSVSSIEIAAALVHEMAHAFLGKHYDDSYSTFSDLYVKYINETGIENYSHDIMKDQFINRMATAIRNYDNTIFSNFEDYKILASQGVFDLSSSQLTYLSQIKNKARQNDSNCN